MIMMLFLFTFYTFFLVVIYGHSDEDCAATEYFNALKDESPSYAASVEHQTELCHEFVESTRGQHRFHRDVSDPVRRRLAASIRRRAMDSDLDDPVLILPVVFHVLYKESKTEANIPMSQINSQINVMNDDFRSLNAAFDDPDISDPEWPWSNRVGDVKIKFVKEAVYRYVMDEDWTCIWGEAGLDDERELKLNNDEWNGVNSIGPEKLLNVWICDLQGWAGYAARCELDDDVWRDGIVIGYKYVGDIDDDDGTFVKFNTGTRIHGRTGTHEVGHYLDLPHIWGDQDGCDEDDGISDTPAQDTSNSGCPADTTDSCPDDDERDMYENIMDYSSDECRFMFSQEQATFMRGLFENGNCRADMGLTSFKTPIECSNDPCLESEAGLCNIYHDQTGCSQCNPFAFKQDYNYPCVDCTEAFGSQCLFCADFGGCCQCTPNTFNLVTDKITGLGYCEPTPCYFPELHCKDCNNGGCCQCETGYQLIEGSCYPINGF